MNYKNLILTIAVTLCGGIAAIATVNLLQKREYNRGVQDCKNSTNQLILEVINENHKLNCENRKLDLENEKLAGENLHLSRERKSDS